MMVLAGSSSKGFLAGCLVLLDAGSTNCLAPKTWKFLSILIKGHYPAGFLMLIWLTSTRSD